VTIQMTLLVSLQCVLQNVHENVDILKCQLL
jgi:hypothetical protein